MKKIISMLLTVMLIIGTVSSALLIPASAADNSTDPLVATSNLYDVNAWETFGADVTVGTTTSTAHLSWGTEEVCSDQVSGINNSLKIHAASGVIAVALSVEPQTDYDIKLSYLSTGTPASILSFVGVFKNNSQITYSSEGMLAQKKVSGNKTGDTWYSVSLSFKSGENSTVILGLRALSPTNSDVYLANLNLIKAADDLENLSLWHRGSVVADSKISDSASSQMVAVGSESTPNKPVNSLHLTGNGASWAWGRFLKLEKNTSYRLSLDYYSVSTTYTPIYALGIIKDIDENSKWTEAFPGGGGWADHSENLGNKLVSQVEVANTSYAVGTTDLINYKDNAWHTFTADFNSGSTTSALLEFIVQTGDTYIANLKLEVIPERDENEFGFNAVNYANNQKVSQIWNTTNNNVTLKVDTKVNGAESKTSLKYSSKTESYIAKQFALTPYTTYTFSYDYYTECALTGSGTNLYFIESNRIFENDGIAAWASPDAVAYVGYNAHYWGPKNANKSGMAWYNRTLYDYTTQKAVSANQWNKSSITFTTGINGNVTLFIHIPENTNTIWFDNFELLTETGASHLADGDVLDITTGIGVSMRTDPNKESGIRFKNNILNSIKDSGIDGYTVAEYGYVVEKTKTLNDDPLTLNNKLASGAAYNAKDGKDIVFESFERTDDGRPANSRDFTTVLINMPTKNFGEKYSVRVYVKLTKDDKEITLYDDETQVYSLYDAVCLVIDTAVTAQNDTTISEKKKADLAADKTAVVDWVNSKSLADEVKSYADNNANTLGIDAGNITSAFTTTN